MRIAAMATMAVLAGMAAQAQGKARLDEAQPGKAEPGNPARVTVCIQGLADFSLMARAQGIATNMFKGVGVKIAWHEMSGCPAQAILISMSEHAPASFHPGAMAYAMPYEGAHIVLFHDRIAATGKALLPHLMAHVMVHEITHILQGVDRHSEEGVMKAHFGQEDFDRMIVKSLEFTPGDVEMIQSGLLAREAHRNTAEPKLVGAQ